MTLIGGLGADLMDGGTGDDVFQLDSADDCGIVVGERDQIDGFDNPGAADGDQIDLSAVAGGASLTWMGGADFTGINQVRVYTRSTNKATIVAINTAGGTTPESRIEILDGAGVDDSAYTAADFLLGAGGPGTITGTEGNDTLTVHRATMSSTRLAATTKPLPAGNDTIDGGAGNDTLDGGDDDDVISGERIVALTDLGTETEANYTFATRDTVTAGSIDGIAYQLTGELASAGGDVDFVEFELGTAAAGSAFTAEVTADYEYPYINLGLFDAAGTLIVSDYNNYPLTTAHVDGTVPGDGQVVVAVTSRSDRDFDGNGDWSGEPHDEAGPYKLVLGTPQGAGNNSILGGPGNDVITDSAGTTSAILAGGGDDTVTVDMVVEEELAGTLTLDIIIEGDEGADTILSAPFVINTQYGDSDNPYGFAEVTHRVEGGEGDDQIQVFPTAEAWNYESDDGRTYTTVFGDDGADTIDVRPEGNGFNSGTITAGLTTMTSASTAAGETHRLIFRAVKELTPLPWMTAVGPAAAVST